MATKKFSKTELGSRCTSDSKTMVKALFVVLATAVLVLGPALAATGDADAISIPGITGFITNDGLFFVQVGYQNLVGYTTYVSNGTQVYAAGITINVTAITGSEQVAHISIYSYGANATIQSLSVTVPGYTSIAVPVSLAQVNAWIEYRITVDNTPWWIQAFTPYSFLAITGLQDGGVDFATFIAIIIFFCYALPLMIKSERMTKRAIYSPKWNALVWLHGIFIGFLADYAIYFSWWNMTFHGWEFIFIPIPEAIFLFFWNAGRHSQNRRALFMQIVPRSGQRMGVILRAWFVGKDEDGDLVIMYSRSPIQWWYRAHGHHIKVFRRSEVGALEPFPLDVIEQTQLTVDQVRDPARFPRGAKYDAHDDFPVINTDDSEEYPFERVYFVPRVSAFRVTPPRLVWHKDVKVPAHLSAVDGGSIPETTVSKLCWPYVQDGSADITLCSWHHMDVLAQMYGYMTSEDAATECDNLSIQLAAERGFRQTLTGRKASAQVNAENYTRDMPTEDLPEDQLAKYVMALPSGRRDKKAMPSGESEDRA